MEIIPFMEAFTAFMRRLPLELSSSAFVQVREPVFVEPEPLETTSPLRLFTSEKVMLPEAVSRATVSAVTAIVLFMLPLPMEADRSALRSAGR